MLHHKISKDLGMRWAGIYGWQEGAWMTFSVLLFHINIKISCDHVKMLMTEANLFLNLTVSKPNRSQEQTCDRGKIMMLAANHLKNLAGNTQNINKSKINLDSLHSQ